MTKFHAWYKSLVTKLMHNDANATWDEILDENNGDLGEAINDLIGGLREAQQGVDVQEYLFYDTILQSAKKLYIRYTAKTTGMTMLLLPVGDAQTLYDILQHSYLTNRELYCELDAHDNLRAAKSMMESIESAYYKSTGKFLIPVHTEWERINTGGHCMVDYKDVICKDGKARMVGVNDECIVLYNCTFNEYWIANNPDAGYDEDVYDRYQMIELLELDVYLSVCKRQYQYTLDLV